MLCPLPKDRCAYAHAGRTLFNRDFKIMRHAHRDNVHKDCGQVSCSDLVPQRTELAKIWTRFLRIVGKGRNGHQSAEFELPESRSGAQKLFKFIGVRGQATLCALASHINFDQYR